MVTARETLGQSASKLHQSITISQILSGLVGSGLDCRAGISVLYPGRTHELCYYLSPQLPSNHENLTLRLSNVGTTSVTLAKHRTMQHRVNITCLLGT